MSKHIRKVLGLLQHKKQIQQIPPPHQQPISRTPEQWSTYWKEQGQPWRTEPEIDRTRQEELSKCRRDIVPDIEKGNYPFKGMKLSRADIEWLLATHENGLGPVEWSDTDQRKREGLDLRGADLRQVNLQGLPLARLCGGLTKGEQEWATEEQCVMARAHMEGVVLEKAQLQGADLHHVYLEGANLSEAQLESSDLTDARLQSSNLFKVQLQQTDLSRVRLQEGSLYGAQLQGATLRMARLERVDLYHAQLEDADLREVKLEGAYLRNVALTSQEHMGPLLADVQWTDVNLAIVNWSQGMILGDEQEAREKKTNGKEKSKEQQLTEYERAVRANRQLVAALQTQGLNEEAARFAYRAQVLQQQVLLRQIFQRKVKLRQRIQKSGVYLFSLFLYLVAGYGYRIWRILAAYLFIVLLCAGAYFILGMYYEPHLSFLEAVLTSVTAFHGRVFSEPFLRPGEPQLWVTAFEAIAGLVIEGVFIAMLTQRFFGK